MEGVARWSSGSHVWSPATPLTWLSTESKGVSFQMVTSEFFLLMFDVGALKKINLGLYQYKGEISVCKNTFCLS